MARRLILLLVVAACTEVPMTTNRPISDPATVAAAEPVTATMRTATFAMG